MNFNLNQNPSNSGVGTLPNYNLPNLFICNSDPTFICNALPHYCRPDNSSSCTDIVSKKLDNLNNSHDFSTCSTKLLACHMPGCLTCNIFNPSHFFRSTITGRVYHIDSELLTCKSRNLIYLLTCLDCHLQYIGETRQELHNRISGHRSSVNVDIGLISGNKLLCTHFSQNLFCRLKGFTVQIIHKLPGDGLLPDGNPDPNMTSARKSLERAYMSKLRTCYPYGMNDRFNTTDLMSNIDRLNVHDLCFYNLDKINVLLTDHSDWLVDKNSFNFQNGYDVLHLITTRCTCTNQSPCMEMLTFVNWLANNVVLKSIAFEFIKLITHKLFSQIDLNYNQQFLYACLDLFNFKFNNFKTNSLVDKCPPELILKIQFSHKIIEFLDFNKFLTSSRFKELCPLGRKTKPTLIYTYLPPISCKIFNYVDCFTNINVLDYINSYIVDPSPPCDCINSPYKDSNHDHVITGDLNIIKNKKLKKLFKLGPTFRTIPRLDIQSIHTKLVEDFNSSVVKWCKKYFLPKAAFSPLMDYFSTFCLDHLFIFENKFSFTNDLNLSDPQLKVALNSLQDKYLITPIDKACNNIALTCKWYSIFITVSELGLLPNTGNNTYINTHLEEIEVIEMIKDTFPFSYLTDADNPKLPFIYPIPKLHKSPIKFRFIVSGVNTILKPAQRACTKILKAVQSQHKYYCDLLFSYSGIKRMWITNNFIDIIDSIENINKHNRAHDTESYDFSTLYTNLDHKSLINNINWCINKAFNNHNRVYVNFSSLSSKFVQFSAKPTNKFYFNILESITLHTWLVHNTYFKCGNTVLTQKIGVPIGENQAPYQANLVLYKDEFVFIEKLCKNKFSKIAKTFNDTHRFLDDINPKNNYGNFNLYKDSIYSPGLIINKENADNSRTSMLEIDMFVEIESKKFTTFLYDKRDKFGFPIVKYPSLNSNIHRTTVYNVFTTQIIRYSRVCNDLKYFLVALKSLFSTMVSKKCKKHVLLKKLFLVLVKRNILTKYDVTLNFNHVYFLLTSYLKN